MGLTFDFDYEKLLEKYNCENIDNSVIKYSDAVSNWSTELMNIICRLEKEKSEIISRCSGLIKSYNIQCDNEVQRIFVEKYQKFLNDTFSFEKKIDVLKNILIQIKCEAEELKKEVRACLSSGNVFKNLSYAEKTERPLFSLITESTANEVKNIISEVEMFEKDGSFIENSIRIIDSWTRKYCEFVLEISDYDLFKRIFEELYNLLIPLLSRQYNKGLVDLQEDEITISEKIIAELEVLRMDIENCYKDTFIDDSDKLIKFYAAYSSFINNIEDIIFDCKDYDDRIFIMDSVMNIFEQYKNVTSYILGEETCYEEIYDFSGCLSDINKYRKVSAKTSEVLKKMLFQPNIRISRNDFSKGKIDFGRYNGKPITWKILKKYDDYALAIGPAVCEMSFNDRMIYSENGHFIAHNDWEKSSLREWLNNDFYRESFNELEKSMIKTEDGESVTLLSKEEAETLMSPKERVIKKFWWLRSKFYTSESYLYAVDSIGIISTRFYSNKCEVRPVIKILIK